MAASAAAALAASGAPAWAHGPGLVPGSADGSAGAEAFLQAFVSVAMLAAAILYFWGARSLGRRLGRKPAAASAIAPLLFMSGHVALGVALLSPLASIEGLFTAHMVQHVVLVALAPPLLLMGRPDLFCVHGFSRAGRRAFFRAPAVRMGLAGLSAVARPLPASVLHGAAIWAWHAPAAFEAAERSAWLHALEHLSFFATALLFWQGIVRAKNPLAALAGGASALATLVHSGFLAALLAFSPIVLYPAATAGAPLWGLTPLEDQQLAGAVMWVPAGLVYLIAGLALVARAISPRSWPHPWPRPSPTFGPGRSPAA